MRRALIAVAATLFAAGSAGAQQRIVNGGFETGDFTGWTVSTQPGSSGAFYIGSTTCTPANCFANNGPRSGSFYAVTDQGGPGAYELSQTFTLTGATASAIFQFSIADNNQAGITYNCGNLDYSCIPNQNVEVDLFSGGSYTPLSVGSLANFFTGTSVDLGGTQWFDYSVDVTSYLDAAGTYTVRFAEVDNQSFHSLSVDNVSLETTDAAPEPASMVLLATGLAGVFGVARRRRKN